MDIEKSTETAATALADQRRMDITANAKRFIDSGAKASDLLDDATMFSNAGLAVLELVAEQIGDGDGYLAANPTQAGLCLWGAIHLLEIGHDSVSAAHERMIAEARP